jgi:hypothetical protein
MGWIMKSDPSPHNFAEYLQRDWFGHEKTQMKQEHTEGPEDLSLALSLRAL